MPPKSLQKTEKPTTTNVAKVLACVPYQCCPVCNGSGQMLSNGFTSTVYQQCAVCHGARIIPMHIIDSNFSAK